MGSMTRHREPTMTVGGPATRSVDGHLRVDVRLPLRLSLYELCIAAALEFGGDPIPGPAKIRRRVGECIARKGQQEIALYLADCDDEAYEEVVERFNYWLPYVAQSFGFPHSPEELETERLEERK